MAERRRLSKRQASALPRKPPRLAPSSAAARWDLKERNSPSIELRLTATKIQAQRQGCTLPYCASVEPEGLPQGGPRFGLADSIVEARKAFVLDANEGSFYPSQPGARFAVDTRFAHRDAATPTIPTPLRVKGPPCNS